MSTTIAHFTITGDFVTRHAREFASEGDWEKAVHFLMTSLEGINYDHAIDIVSGKKKLTGQNSDIQLVKDGADSKYLEHMKWLYKGHVKIKNTWYSPYAYVSSFGPKDLWYDAPVSMQDLAQRRARFYADDRIGDLVILCRLEWAEDFEYNVLFKKVPPPPIWMFDEFLKRKPQDVVSDPLENRGFMEWFGKEGFGGMFEKKDSLGGAPVYAEIPEKEEVPAPVVPDKEYASNFGWILPNGDFYGCEFHGHMARCCDIFSDVLKEDVPGNPEKVADDRGWLKIGTTMVREFKDGEYDGLVESRYGIDKPLTQAQKDALFGWCTKHKVSYPQERIDLIEGLEKL